MDIVAICNYLGLLVMHYAIIYLALISSVPLWDYDAERTNFAEESAGIDTQFFGGRPAIAIVTPKGVCYVQGFEGLQG